MAFYNAEMVRDAAKGNWLFILATLAPALEPALKKLGRHVPCPIHGGKDGFRLFKDAHDTGGGICNSCGGRHDGFEMLMWVNDWSFKDTLNEVGDYLRVEKQESRKKRPEAKVEPLEAKRTYQGELVRHDKAPFRHDESNRDSYFVELRDDKGSHFTVWGVDLERAMSESSVQAGMQIRLSNASRKVVTVNRQVKDANGHVVLEPIQSHRNQWSVEVVGKPVEHVAQAEEPKSTTNVHSEQTTDESKNVRSEQSSNEAENVHSDQNDTSNVLPFLKDSAQPWLLKLQNKAENQNQVVSNERIEKMWEECVTYPGLDTSPMKAYFQGRGLIFSVDPVNESDCLRFHPALPYYNEDGKKVRDFPAIVCAIRDVNGQIVTLHRTYLTSKGKKAGPKNGVSAAKKMMSIPEGLDVKGAAVRLGEPQEGILGVAEGLETALSAYRVTGYPTWSTVNAVLMESFNVPKGVHTVFIWADRDRSLTGERSANKLKARLEEEGIRCYVLLPKIPIPKKAKGVDWNDVLETQGYLGFPGRRYLEGFLARQMADDNN